MASNTGGVIGNFERFNLDTINVEGDLRDNSYERATRKVKYDTGTFEQPKFKKAEAATDSDVEREKLRTYKTSLEEESNAKAAIAAGNFVVDVLNAQAAYNAAQGQAVQNITAAHNQKADTLFLGRQAQLQAQSEGYNAGQDATLAMAAQGQDVNGSAVGKIQSSFEVMGIEAGSRHYQNAIREALGYDIEEINTRAQLKAAKAARNAAIIGSALTNGTKAAMGAS